MANTNTNNQKPVAKYKLGALRAAVWKNGDQVRSAVQRLLQSDLQSRRRLERDRQLPTR